MNGRVAPMPSGGVIKSGYVETPPWAFRVRSTSIADSSAIGRAMLTAASQSVVRELLGISNSGAGSVTLSLDADGNLIKTSDSSVVLNIPKTTNFIDTDYLALVTNALEV